MSGPGIRRLVAHPLPLGDEGRDKTRSAPRQHVYGELFKAKNVPAPFKDNVVPFRGSRGRRK